MPTDDLGGDDVKQPFDDDISLNEMYRKIYKNAKNISDDKLEIKRKKNTAAAA